jgi:hypothetical protein
MIASRRGAEGALLDASCLRGPVTSPHHDGDKRRDHLFRDAGIALVRRIDAKTPRGS